MSQPLIVITGLIYAYVAIEQWLKGSAGNAIMFARCLILVTAALFTLAWEAWAEDLPLIQHMPSAQDATVIEAHASTWDLLLERERLREMATHWTALSTKPDSSLAWATTMLFLANEIVGKLTLSTGLPNATLMRWLEKDVGLKPYFFPPPPEHKEEKKHGEVWKVLTPLLPIILYRVVDRLVK